MSATNKTTNYQLPIFVGTDIPSWLTDFNGAMQKIDTAVKSASTTGGVTKDYVDNAIATIQTDIESMQTQINTISTKVTELMTKLNSALVLGTTAAGVTADQYDKITNVSLK